MTVALGQKSSYASENHEKLNHFMEELINGK